MSDLAGKAASSHTHTSSQITDATAAATASTVVLRDGSGGANFAYAAANNLWAFLDSHLQSVECGAFQTVGGPYENMLKYSEDFSVGTWDKNGGTCYGDRERGRRARWQPDRRHDHREWRGGLIQQNVAGLVANGQYTFYVWLKVASGTMTVSLGILDNGWTTWLVGPTAVTLTTSWQRFKVTGTMTGGADRRSGSPSAITRMAGPPASRSMRGARASSRATIRRRRTRARGDTRPRRSRREWPAVPLVVSAINNTDSPFKVRGPGSPSRTTRSSRSRRAAN